MLGKLLCLDFLWGTLGSSFLEILLGDHSLASRKVSKRGVKHGIREKCTGLRVRRLGVKSQFDHKLTKEGPRLRLPHSEKEGSMRDERKH